MKRKKIPGQSYLLRRCTYAGRPFGDEEFVRRLEQQFDRKWRRWSFEKALQNRRMAQTVE